MSSPAWEVSFLSAAQGWGGVQPHTRAGTYPGSSSKGCPGSRVLIPNTCPDHEIIPTSAFGLEDGPREQYAWQTLLCGPMWAPPTLTSPPGRDLGTPGGTGAGHSWHDPEHSTCEPGAQEMLLVYLLKARLSPHRGSCQASSLIQSFYTR